MYIYIGSDYCALFFAFFCALLIPPTQPQIIFLILSCDNISRNVTKLRPANLVPSSFFAFNWIEFTESNNYILVGIC